MINPRLYTEGVYSDYIHAVNDLQKGSIKDIRIFVCRSYMGEMIQPIIDVLLKNKGLNPIWKWGNYNQFQQEVLNPNSQLYEFKPDLILFLLRLEDMKDIAASDIAKWVVTLKNKLGALILMQNFILKPTFNSALTDLTWRHSLFFVRDYNQCVLRHGFQTISSDKLFYSSKIPYSNEGFSILGRDLSKAVMSLFLPVKKCVVLDLDNTLWGGILGEDGFDGIALGQSYPGNAYMAFQERLKQLLSRGILLALNSKNNKAEALDTIRRHPGMVLKEADFSAIRINWKDKALNMVSLSEELNIGLDSMIFFDDNPVECERVSMAHPQLDVYQVPKKTYQILSILDKVIQIETLRLTDEDKLRSELYKQQKKSDQEKYTAASLEDFLSSLKMKISIDAVDSFSLSRVAQLTQKTNQFNLTTKRYTEKNIQHFCDLRLAFSVSCTDKFGDNGIIGAILLKKDKNVLVIDTFLLSCRVILRNIEFSMIDYCLNLAKSLNLSIVRGLYFSTEKNKPCHSFYDKLGFIKIKEGVFEQTVL